MNRDFSKYRKIKAELIEDERSSEILESVDEIFKQEKIFVYSEGKDEKKYFDNLDRDINSSRVKIIAENCGGGDCFRVCSVAKERFQSELEKDSDLNDCKKYVVFDRDRNFIPCESCNGKTKFELSKDVCINENFEIIFSNMCYEIWVLCHYLNPEEMYSKDELNDRDFLKKESKRLGKSYNKLKSHRENAFVNAEILINLHKASDTNLHSIDSNPVTQIGFLIKTLLERDR